MNMSAKEVDTPETLLPLNRIRANATLKYTVYCSPGGLASSFLLIRFDSNAEVEIDSGEDVKGQ
jgi:hypothetical protein